MNLVKYLLALLRITVTRDYGMCCSREQAKKQIRRYYFE